jgi:hypothetical protein
MLEIILAWTMSCTQYDEAIKNLYKDEYFARLENLEHRSDLHKFFKSKTKPQCVTELARKNEK